MNRWKKLLLGGLILGTLAAVLLASGYVTPPTKAAGNTVVLPPAVTPPDQASLQTAGAPAASPEQDKAAANPEERITSLVKELKENEKNTAGWAELGSLYGKLRRYPPAADAFAAALEFEPNNSEYRSAYATALFFSGMSRLALKEYRYVVEKDPQNAGAHMNLAVALSHSAPPDIPAAILEWEEVIRLAPGQPVATKAQEYLAGYRKP